MSIVHWTSIRVDRLPRPSVFFLNNLIHNSTESVHQVQRHVDHHRRIYSHPPHLLGKPQVPDWEPEPELQLISATTTSDCPQAKESVNRLLDWGKGRWLKLTDGTKLTDDHGTSAHVLTYNDFNDRDSIQRDGWVAYSLPAPDGDLPSSRPVLVISSDTVVTNEHANELFRYSAARGDGDNPTVPSDGTFKPLDANVIPPYRNVVRLKVGVSSSDSLDCQIFKQMTEPSGSPGSISGLHVCGGSEERDEGGNLVLSDVKFHWLEAVDSV